MKTAMQELIEIFNHELKLGEATLSNDEGYMLKWAIFNAKSLLEKEKEQIIDFHIMLMKNGLEQEGNAIEWEYNELKEEALKFYNQTYNQKQHIIDIMKADENDGLYKMFDTDSDKKH
jgi:hypothetical protein